MQQSGTQVRERYLAYVSQMQQKKAEVGQVSEAMENFDHITDNFAAGLFHCYDVKGLRRTNNELEHCFGVARVHERRATGRRGAIPGVVVRGSVRLLAVVVATREDVQAADLQPTDYQKWRAPGRQLWSRPAAPPHQRPAPHAPATSVLPLQPPA